MVSKQTTSLRAKRDLAQRNVDKFTRLAAAPNLSPKAAALARNMLRSYRAEVALREMALTYQATIADGTHLLSRFLRDRSMKRAPPA